MHVNESFGIGQRTYVAHCPQTQRLARLAGYYRVSRHAHGWLVDTFHSHHHVLLFSIQFAADGTAESVWISSPDREQQGWRIIGQQVFAAAVPIRRSIRRRLRDMRKQTLDEWLVHGAEGLPHRKGDVAQVKPTLIPRMAEVSASCWTYRSPRFDERVLRLLDAALLRVPDLTHEERVNPCFTDYWAS